MLLVGCACVAQGTRNFSQQQKEEKRKRDAHMVKQGERSEGMNKQKTESFFRRHVDGEQGNKSVTGHHTDTDTHTHTRTRADTDMAESGQRERALHISKNDDPTCIPAILSPEQRVCGGDQHQWRWSRSLCPSCMFSSIHT